MASMNIRFQIQNRRGRISEPENVRPKGFFLVCLISLICHMLFFISLFFINDFQFSAPKPKVVTVDLVTFAPGPANAKAPGTPPRSEEPAPDQADKVNPDAVSQIESQPAEPQQQEIPVIKPDVGLKSKPKNLNELIAARDKEPPKKSHPKKILPKRKESRKKKPKKNGPRNLPRPEKLRLKNVKGKGRLSLKMRWTG